MNLNHAGVQGTHATKCLDGGQCPLILDDGRQGLPHAADVVASGWLVMRKAHQHSSGRSTWPPAGFNHKWGASSPVSPALHLLLSLGGCAVDSGCRPKRASATGGRGDDGNINPYLLSASAHRDVHNAFRHHGALLQERLVIGPTIVQPSTKVSRDAIMPADDMPPTGT